MFDLSKRARLGLYVMVELARSPGAQRSNEDLAEALRVSGNHLAKVLQTLAKAGWIVGTRGAGGGYRADFDPKRVSMADVVALFEGEPSLAPATHAGHDCDHAADCAIKKVVQEIEVQAYYTLQSVTVDMLSRTGWAAPATEAAHTHRG
jgi:Rrf2 family protein